jgi:hypothetical protein
MADTPQTPSVGRIVHFVLGDGQLRPAIVTRDPDSRDQEVTNGKCKLQLQVFLDRTADRQHGQHEGELHGRPAIMYMENGFSQKCVDADDFAAQVPYDSGNDVGTYPVKTWHWPKCA